MPGRLHIIFEIWDAMNEEERADIFRRVMGCVLVNAPVSAPAAEGNTPTSEAGDITSGRFKLVKCGDNTRVVVPVAEREWREF